MTATLLQGDCLELMKSLPDKSIDCFICDLPYGQLSTGNNKGERTDIKVLDYKNTNEVKIKKLNTYGYACTWDVKIDLNSFWEQVERLAKADNTPVIHFCNTKFGIELINSKPDWFRYDLVWNKERGISFLLANKMPMKSHEMIYIFSKKGTYYNRIDIKTDKKEWIRSRPKERDSSHYGSPLLLNQQGGKDGFRCSLSVINIKKSNILGHPTEKPRELYRWLLERYCPPGGTVLDPTAGSFNSIEVAYDMGLDSIGIEKDETFFDRALDKMYKK